MLKANLIGNLGADAEVKSANGREFVTFRVAHSWNFTASDGTNISLRVYSSKQDKCMKAGLTIHVENVQLIGGKVDLVPKQVIDPVDGSIHETIKRYIITDMAGLVKPDEYKNMVDEKGHKYVLNCLGYIEPYSNESPQS